MWYSVMPEERRSVLVVLACGVAGALLVAGCGASSPEMGQAEDAMEQRDVETALANVERALDRDSANTDAYLLKAKLLRQKADSTMPPDAYIDLYRRAHRAEARAIEFADGLRDDVTERRRRIYTREKRRGESAYNRGSKNDTKALFRFAVGFFGAAGATLPDSAGPVRDEAYARLRLDQRTEVIPVLERYLERAERPERKPFKILGELYVSNGRYEDAATVLDRAIRLYPDDADLQALRLNAYNRTGDADEALAAYREQIERTPNRARYRYNYGALLLKARRYDDAIDQLRTAVELEPDNAEGQYNLGAAYLNAALVRDDSIATVEADPSVVEAAGRSSRTVLDSLSQRRERLFEKAVPPLERARRLVEEDRILRRKGADALRQEACRALLVAYVQTDRPNKAAQVEDCTGFARAEP
jgi:tetratricopeptide (TPR) repeat protein